MRNLILLWTYIIIALIGCKNDPLNNDLKNNKSKLNDYISKLNFKDDSSIININGSWKVLSYADYKINSVTLKSDVQSLGMDVILTFNNDSLYGINTRNEIQGNYTLSGRNIHIIRYGGTKVGQPVWGNMFSDVVFKFESFEIDKNYLRIYYNNLNNSVTFIHN
jgi:hypothetical protein